MTDSSRVDISISQQDVIQEQRVHPTNEFFRFDRKEIEQSIPDRFEKQVEKYPDRLAIKTRSGDITYKALNQQANRLAHAILDLRGSEKEQIALVLENDVPIIAAMLGVLKTGKTYVPLDPLLPESRINYILEDSQSSLIITNNKNLEMAKEMAEDKLPLLNIDLIDPEISVENPNLGVSPDIPTWILYTSGSTGQPKGVVQTHRNVLHFVMNYTNGLHICTDDRFLLIFSCSVNAGAHVIYSALFNGASLYLLDIKAEGLAHLAEWLTQNNITIYTSVPTILLHFIDVLSADNEFPDLRLVMMFGEPVYKNHLELARKHFPQNCIFVNRLGSTETGSIRWHFIDSETQIDGINVPVGYPVEDNQILLLDDNAKEVKPGEVGEISVRSRYISPGYWHKPDRTAAAFLPDPEGGDRRIYRTGDLGSMLPDGCIVHMGRKDFQVKIKGYRIEVAEIETALLKHDAISKVAVWPWEDPSGNKRLVAYIIINGQEMPPVNEFRHLLSESLPAYMMPFYFEEVDVFPLAPNGKLDRKALPPPNTARPNLANPFAPPRKSTEEKLAKIWREVLGFDEVGIQDNFSDLGGESLMAAQILARIQDTFGKNFPLAAILQSPTIEEMAKILEQSGSISSASLLTSIQPEGLKLPLFCIHGCSCEILDYFTLSHHLGKQQPLYAIRARGIYGEAQPHRQLEEAATEYIREMKAVQSEGPYRLCSIGAGGLLVYEMAQQLLSQGQEVDLLAIIDARHNEFVPPHEAEKRALRESSSGGAYHPANLSQNPLVRNIQIFYHNLKKGQIRYIFRGIGNIFRLIFRISRWKFRRSKLYSATIYSFIPRHVSFIRRRIDYTYYAKVIFYRAGLNYTPVPYSGKVVFFMPEESKKNFQEDWYDWATGGLEIRDLPGDHQNILKEPNVRSLAEQLKSLLD